MYVSRLGKVLLLLALIGSGCQQVGSSPSDTLIVGIGGPPTNLDPRRATDAYSQRISDLLFSSLVRNGPDLQPVPQAALSWKVDRKKITFELRGDLNFSNGRKVTAKDVVYSLSEFKKSTSPFASALSAIQSFEAPDDQKIVLHLSEDDASLLSNLNDVKILPREEVEKWGDQFAQHLIGSGPYVLTNLDNNQIDLKVSPQLSYSKPKISKIIFKIVRDTNTQYLKMIKGDLDILSNELPEEKVNELRKSDKVEVLVTPGLNFNFLVLNLKDMRLKNKRIRQALFAALNRDEIVKYKLENLAITATTIVAPPSPFSSEDIHFSKISLEEAKKIISESKLEGAEFNLLTSDQALPNAQIIAQQWERLGIKVNLRSLEWGTFYTDLKAGRFQIATSRWVGIVDPDIYRDSLHSREIPPGRNRGGYLNPTFDKLVEKARQENDFDKRRLLYRKAEQIVADDLPILPLWYNANISIVSKRVKNFVPIVTGSFFPFTEVSKE